MSFEKLKIKEYKHWALFLNENQCYLGRVCLVAKREDAVDLFETTVAEREEFFQAGEEICRTLQLAFQPDLMNYASLGNSFRHLHVHFIPRYSSERVFHNRKFVDTRWGKNYEPYDRNFKLSGEELEAIKLAL
jgi:diadenosine tetraphosphate (Ap4A) HIT family hydrolase